MKEILKHLVEHVTLPEDAYLGQDEEILEIFVEEGALNWSGFYKLCDNQLILIPDITKIFQSWKKNDFTLNWDGSQYQNYDIDNDIREFLSGS